MALHGLLFPHCCYSLSVWPSLQAEQQQHDSVQSWHHCPQTAEQESWRWVTVGSLIAQGCMWDLSVLCIMYQVMLAATDCSHSGGLRVAVAKIASVVFLVLFVCVLMHNLTDRWVCSVIIFIHTLAGYFCLCIYAWAYKLQTKGERESDFSCLTAAHERCPCLGRDIVSGDVSGCGEVSVSVGNKEGGRWFGFRQQTSDQFSSLAPTILFECNYIVTMSVINLVLNPFPGAFKSTLKHDKTTSHLGDVGITASLRCTGKKPSLEQTVVNKNIHARVLMENGAPRHDSVIRQV